MIKSPGDLRRLAVTQTPVKNHRLTLIRKALMSVLENGSHKLLWDINIKTDYLIPAR